MRQRAGPCAATLREGSTVRGCGPAPSHPSAPTALVSQARRKDTYRPHPDGIRAAAVILVILFHLLSRWMPGRFVRVDVFFVLSGYLITGLLVDELARD